MDGVSARSFKPIPDEEGTESDTIDACTQLWRQSFKPIPDEEGTERRISRAASAVGVIALQTDPR